MIWTIVTIESFWEKQFLFRPSMRSAVATPMRLRSMGLYGVDKGWRDVEKTIDYVQLHWVLEGELDFCAGKKTWRAGAGETAVLFPGDRLRVKAVRRTRYRWLTIDGPLAEELVRAFGVGHSSCAPGPCPDELFEELRTAIRRITPMGQKKASVLAYQLFSLAASDQRGAATEGSLADEALEYIQQQFADPDLNVNSLADRLNVNRSVLSRAFHRTHGITIIRALCEQRFQAATSLLREKALPVSEVVRRCGYSDPAYFSRVIKARLGRGPRAFKKN